MRHFARTLVVLSVALPAVLGVASSCGTTASETRSGDGTVAGSAVAPLLWVVQEGNLVTYGEDLKELDRFPIGVDGVDSLSVTPDGKVLFALSGKEVTRIDLAERSAKQLAALPAATKCEEYYGPVLLQDVRSTYVSADGGAFCATLQDRNDNMASLQVTYAVDVTSGAVSYSVGLDLDSGCGGEQDAGTERCVHVPRPGSRGAATFEAVAGEGCALKIATGATINLPKREELQGPCEPGEEGVSASGRFFGASVLVDDSGDNIYRSLYFVDAQKGILLQGLTDGAVGDTQLEWAPRADVLVIDGTVYRLGDTVETLVLNRSVIFVP